MKKLSLQIVRLRINFIRKMIALIGITAIVSCGNSSKKADSARDNIPTDDKEELSDTIFYDEHENNNTTPVIGKTKHEQIDTSDYYDDEKYRPRPKYGARSVIK